MTRKKAISLAFLRAGGERACADARFDSAAFKGGAAAGSCLAKKIGISSLCAVLALALCVPAPAYAAFGAAQEGSSEQMAGWAAQEGQTTDAAPDAQEGQDTGAADGVQALGSAGVAYDAQGVQGSQEGQDAQTVQPEQLAQVEQTTQQATQASDISWYTANPEAVSYSLVSPAQLRGLADLVNGTADINGDGAPDGVFVSFEGVIITQAFDLILAGIGANGEWVYDSFTPIGTPEHPFAGTYDGANHSIYGLLVNTKTSYAGLFGYASASSEVKNVVIGNGDGETMPESTVEITTSTQMVKHVGSLVGRTEGKVSACRSAANVTVSSATKATEVDKSVVHAVGGMIGSCTGDVSDCIYEKGACLAVNVASDAYDKTSSQSEALRVADSFGGVVGRFGDPATYGTLSGCANEGTVWVIATGAGATDRFHTVTYAAPFYVGGVCGYSNGSVVNCSNGTFDEKRGQTTGLVSTSAVDSPSDAALDNRGGDQVGGVVGGVRSVSDSPDKKNDGSPDHKVSVVNCHNVGTVVGRASVGGVAAELGAYTLVTQCYNGVPGNKEVSHIVSTRWNKPISGGIVGRVWGGTVSYCANYATVENTQTGYYVAGICGALFTSDDYPLLTPELYGCLNTGDIYTANTSSSKEYREAGILGTNEGYVHDCIMRQGSVPYHSDEAVGSMDWGAWDNLEVMTQAEMQTAAAAAFLNAAAAKDQNWDCYWFATEGSYPVLNTWAAEVGTIQLTLESVASIEMLEEAPYLGESGSIATFKVTLTSGAVLVQNTDFYVVAQEGAIEMSSGDARYLASIVGIGLYSGTLSNCAAYSIGKGDLALASVSVSKGKYSFGRVVFPQSVDVSISGKQLSSSTYNYIIYDNATGKVDAGLPQFAVYDSLGFVSFDEGATKEAVAGIDLNSEDKPYILYDRAGQKISDSAGAVYYVEGSGGLVGEAVRGHKSCMGLKTGAPAGYTVKVAANDGSEVLSGTCIGYYVISPLSLYDDCTLESASCQGKTWYWDADMQAFYEKDASGARVEGTPSAVFTGETILPQVNITYAGHALEEGVDYRVVAGDPDPAQVDQQMLDSGAGAQVADGAEVRTADGDDYAAARAEASAAQAADAESDASDMPNRNVTGDTVRAAITVRPVDTVNLSNYLMGYFNIAPAKFEDCDISLASSEYVYTGDAIVPDVSVSLNGVSLVCGVDYTLECSNNKEPGTATYKVVPDSNLSGGSLEPRTGTFEIVSESLLVSEISGDTRVETSIAAARSAYPDGASGVIVASGDNFPDALAASSLAGALDYPIILVQDTAIDVVVKAVQDMGVQKAIVVGGAAAVSNTVFDALAGCLGQSNIERLFGDTRYETQMAIYNYGARRDLWEGDPIIATGMNFPDALSISPYAAWAKAPVFLVGQDGLIAEAQAALRADYSGAKNMVIVGGEAAVSSTAAKQIENITGAVPKRLFGDTRYDTAASVSNYCVSLGMSCATVGVAVGSRPYDALAAGPALAKTGSVVLLADSGLTDAAKAYLTDNASRVRAVVFFGGTGALPQDARDEILSNLSSRL